MHTSTLCLYFAGQKIKQKKTQAVYFLFLIVFPFLFLWGSGEQTLSVAKTPSVGEPNQHTSLPASQGYTGKHLRIFLLSQAPKPVDLKGRVFWQQET